MTSHDVRDVLNLPQDGTAPRPAKKQKTAAPRTNLKGLAREVQSLGGDNPIAIVPEISIFKKRRQASRKPAARWELRPFKNSAREDGSLILRHWRRKTEPGDEGAAEACHSNDGANGDVPMEMTGERETKGEGTLEDSAFAKFNVKVDIPQYNDDQYISTLQSDDWTREETDYLLGVVRDFDLRWPIIWDRYDYHSSRRPNGDTANGNDSATAVIPLPKQRSVEDLKARYYEVAAKMMVAQKPAQYMTQSEFALYETMNNFDPQMETQRKKFAISSLSRSKEEAREEESLLLEVKRILARQERFNEERRDLYNRLDFPHSDQDISQFKSSQGLHALLQTLMSVDNKLKKRKSIMGPDGVISTSSGPNGQQQQQQSASAATENRRDSIAAVSAGGFRGSIGVEKATPTEASAVASAGPTKGNRKGSQHQLPERRKLTEQEEQVYGVSYHDRLGSGPTFRYERVNKLFSHKSGQQQLRITNALNELDIPARLIMPTAAVTAQFEQLVVAVTQLVDLRKHLDKLETEIKVEEARKVERNKARAFLAGQVDGADDGDSDDGERDGDDDGKDGPLVEPSAPEDGNETAFASSDSNAPTSAAKAEAQDAPDPPDANKDQPATNGEAIANGDAVKETASVQATLGEEEAGDKDKASGTRPGSRPGSSGAHKRSASVLSVTSDKSAKRQKK